MLRDTVNYGMALLLLGFFFAVLWAAGTRICYILG